MSARRWLPAAAVVLLGVLAAAFLFAALHRPGGTTVAPGPHAVSVQASLSPQNPQFGDTVLATAEVLVDPHRVDPGSVRLRTSFAPYRVVSAEQSVRTSGGYSAVRLRRVLQCVVTTCVPASTSKSFRFEPLRVTYRQGSGQRTLAASWPVLRVGSRVAAADLAHPVLRVPSTASAPTYRLPPRATGYTLLALATALAVAGAVLLLRVVLRAGVPRLRKPEPLIDRILGELAAANGDAAQRRKALEQLARELEQVDGSLSVESRTLAWGRSDPQADAISELAKRVRAVRAQ